MCCRLVQTLSNTCLKLGTNVAALLLAYVKPNSPHKCKSKHYQADRCMAGEENLDFVESLRKSKIKLVMTRHEMAAGMMAATVGRLTGGKYSIPSQAGIIILDGSDDGLFTKLNGSQDCVNAAV